MNRIRYTLNTQEIKQSEVDKKYNGSVLEYTDVKIRLTDSDLDNAIYYLICARDKLAQGEISAYELRLWSAKAKVRNLK